MDVYTFQATDFLLFMSISLLRFFVYSRLQGWDIDLLDLRPQLLQGAVAVYPIRDIIPKAMPHHPFPISFPDAVGLTKPTEGMAAGVRGSLRESQLLQRVLHIPPELRDALAIEELPLHTLHQRVDR